MNDVLSHFSQAETKHAKEVSRLAKQQGRSKVEANGDHESSPDSLKGEKGDSSPNSPSSLFFTYPPPPQPPPLPYKFLILDCSAMNFLDYVGVMGKTGMGTIIV